MTTKAAKIVKPGDTYVAYCPTDKNIDGHQFRVIREEPNDVRPSVMHWLCDDLTVGGQRAFTADVAADIFKAK